MKDQAGSTGTFTPPRVLVADDDPGMREWLRDSLESAGYHVAEAVNGRKATDLLKRRSVDLCITDLIMPDQEGIETIQLLRREYPALKIIAISGSSIPDMLNVSKLLGAEATLQKPIRLDTLLETVKQVLEA